MKKYPIVIICYAIMFKGASQVPSISPINSTLPAIMNVAGGSYDNTLSYHRYEWSTGESSIVYALARNDSTVLVTHGVLQPCTEKSGLDPAVLNFEWSDYRLFPSLTTGKFEFDLFINSPGFLKLQLINTQGQILETRSVHYNGCCRIEYFDISHRPNGVYLLVADLAPYEPRTDGLLVRRHGGFKIVKIE